MNPQPDPARPGEARAGGPPPPVPAAVLAADRHPGAGRPDAPGTAGPAPGPPPRRAPDGADPYGLPRGTGCGPAEAAAAGPDAAAARGQFAAIAGRAQAAASWRESAGHYARLLNAEGHVRLTARFRAADLAFLGRAQAEVLALAGLGQQLAELHQPLEPAGPQDEDRPGAEPPAAAERCRHCMWRWPCPTFRVIAAALDRLESAELE